MIRRSLIVAAALAATAIPAGTAQAQDIDPDPQRIAHQACHFVADKMGWACIESTSATRSCSRPLGLTSQCIENIICGAPGKALELTGLDEYVDPTINCVQ